MTEYIKKTFALTDTGAKGMLWASFGAFLTNIAYMLPMIVLLIFVQDLLGDGVRGTTFYVGILIGIALVMTLFINYSYGTTYNETYKEAANLRINIADTLKKLPLSFFSKHHVSDLSQTFMQDVADIEHAMSHAIPQFFGFCAFFVMIAIMMVAGSPFLGSALIAPVILSMLLLYLSKKAQVRGTTKYFERLRKNSEIFQETIEMQQEIKSYGQKAETLAALQGAIEDSEKVHIKTELSQVIPICLSVTMLQFTLGLTVLVGSLLYAAGHLSLLYLVGYIIGASRIIDGIASIFSEVGELLMIDARIKRVRTLRQTNCQEGEPYKIKNYSIQLENVDFSYNGESTILHQVSFEAKQGELTALIGPSGCGKTTLLRLMSRLYDYDAGRILIDGKDIKDIAVEDLFDKVSIVFQDITLFNTSIMENIRLGNQGATDEDVIEAAKQAHCHAFISQLPEGYQTLVGENGMKLSGGERQRISIARAILKDAPIILLDEISASLDVENELAIQQSLHQLIKGKTVVIISHRLKSIEKADKIVVLKDGYVEAVGTHEELTQHSPTYAAMLKRSALTDCYQY